MTSSEEAPATGNKALWAIIAVLLIYATSFAAGYPQRWTAAALEGHSSVAEAKAAHGEQKHVAEDVHAAVAPPPLWTVFPFVLLLGAIAVLPLMHATEHWWEKNLNRFFVAVGLGAIVLAYYAFLHAAPIEAHWPGHRVIEPK